MAKQNGNAAGPLTTLRWILAVPINLALVLLFQALLIHTHPAPLTPERAAALPAFSGCEILDIAGPERAGLTVPDLLLRFSKQAGHDLDDDRVLLSDR